MDCCPAHLKAELFATTARLGVRVLLVPAKMTWLMQPLDTHVFQLYKRKLRARWSALRQESLDGAIKNETWWRALMTHVHQFMSEQSWAFTFRATGWLEDGQQASSYLLREAGWRNHPAVAPSPPSAEQLALILPQGRQAAVESNNKAQPASHRVAISGVQAEHDTRRRT